eukprot:m.338822 g.338822  ORF g.338822 m.338822 type:complete len:417 (-) comp20568_c0_seq3:841-2091(-)
MDSIGRGHGIAAGGRGVGDPDWECPNPGCRNRNFARRLECNRCGTGKPASAFPKGGGDMFGAAPPGLHVGDGNGGGPASVAPGSKGSGAMNDWICPNMDCSNKNYARRMECNKCGTKRPRPKIIGPATGIGEKMAEHSKGLFSPEDWQCMMCGNINWAKRSECNVCNHPKEGKIEQREGAGGGFKENDNVQYREFQDDSEYDEFGRKKKKGKRNNPGSVSNSDMIYRQEVPAHADDGQPSVPPEIEDDDEDEGDTSKYDLFNFADDGPAKDSATRNLEEEEEDDDDVDVSKYDFFADDAPAETKSTTTVAQTSTTATTDAAPQPDTTGTPAQSSVMEKTYEADYVHVNRRLVRHQFPDSAPLHILTVHTFVCVSHNHLVLHICSHSYSLVFTTTHCCTQLCNARDVVCASGIFSIR